MAWYCDHCKRYIKSEEIRWGLPSDSVRLYHYICHTQVRAETDESVEEAARAEAHAQEGQQQ